MKAEITQKGGGEGGLAKAEATEHVEKQLMEEGPVGPVETLGDFSSRLF